MTTITVDSLRAEVATLTAEKAKLIENSDHDAAEILRLGGELAERTRERDREASDAAGYQKLAKEAADAEKPGLLVLIVQHDGAEVRIFGPDRSAEERFLGVVKSHGVAAAVDALPGAADNRAAELRKAGGGPICTSSPADLHQPAADLHQLPTHPVEVLREFARISNELECSVHNHNACLDLLDTERSTVATLTARLAASEKARAELVSYLWSIHASLRVALVVCICAVVCYWLWLSRGAS